MTPTGGELVAMRRAIALSAAGLGTAGPNPPVGCVVLDADGRPVGEGYHLRKGEAHAEVHALAAAGRRAAGGTAVVTLEPCNHVGRTPACRQALVDAGVARVLVAVMDPTSRAEGGAQRLREAGIVVETGVLEREALLVLGPWRASLGLGRPVLHWVYRADSRGEPVPHTACSAGEAARLRYAHDLVVDGEGRCREGGPAGHGDGVFHVPGPLAGDVGDVSAALAASGARTVLLDGPSTAARLLAAAGMVDRLTLIGPVPRPSRTPAPDGYLPEGHVLVGVTHLGGQLLVSAVRER